MQPQTQMACPKCGATGKLGEGFRRHGKKLLSASRKIQQYQCTKCGHVFHNGHDVKR